MCFANHKIFTAGYFHNIQVWSIEEIEQRIYEQSIMRAEEFRSMQYNVFYKGLDAKSKKRRKKGKGRSKSAGKAAGKKGGKKK